MQLVAIRSAAAAETAAEAATAQAVLDLQPQVSSCPLRCSFPTNRIALRTRVSCWIPVMLSTGSAFVSHEHRSSPFSGLLEVSGCRMRRKRLRRCCRYC